MSKNKKCGWLSNNYFQSADYNKNVLLLFESWIMQLAENRFRWVGLPDTCNVRVLEQTLVAYGTAAICTPSDVDLAPIWYSLPAVHNGKLNAYGEPTAWRCNGISGGTHFRSDWEHGAFIYNSRSQFPIWNGLKILARRLTHLTRTADINLFNQHTPALIFTTDEMKRDAMNVLKDIAGGEPAIIANKSMLDNIELSAVNMQVPYLGLDLQVAEQNIWNAVYRYLGIEHLAFEKGERMIEEEARGNSYPTNLMLLDAIQARRDAAEYLNTNFGFNIQVYFNNDYESYNWNYINDIERTQNINESDNNE